MFENPDSRSSMAIQKTNLQVMHPILPQPSTTHSHHHHHHQPPTATTTTINHHNHYHTISSPTISTTMCSCDSGITPVCAGCQHHHPRQLLPRPAPPNPPRFSQAFGRYDAQISPPSPSGALNLRRNGLWNSFPVCYSRRREQPGSASQRQEAVGMQRQGLF